MPIGIVLQSVLIPLGFMAFVIVIVWLNHEARRKARERRAELIHQMMDKFPSGEAFAQAIQGPDGSKLVEALTLDSETPSRKGWIGLFIPASILSALSLGFLVLSFLEGLDFLIPAVVIGAVGGALALSTYAMWRADQQDRESSPATQDRKGAAGGGPIAD